MRMPSARARSASSLPISPETDDAELLAVKRDHAGDARPVAVRRVRAVVGRRLVTGVFQLLDADEIGVLRQLARQREHQHQSLLRGGNIGAPADGKNFDAGALHRRHYRCCEW